MENRTKTLLHIIDTLNIGGAEKLLVGVINGLPAYKHYVVYLSGTAPLSRELNPGCTVINLKYRSRLDFFRCVFRLRKIIRQNSIEIVHSHLFLSTLIARLACPKECRLINSLHSMPGRIRYKRSTFVKWADKLTHRKRHDIIGVSENVLLAHDSMVGFKGRTWVLPNYVSDVYYRETSKQIRPDGQLRLVAVGNLKEAKNYTYLLDAFRFLSSSIQLDIYGDGELREELQHQIDEDNLPVRLCGARDDVHTLLPQYDAFIMSSIYEGHPLALLEAMASGLPVILSDIVALRTVAGKDAVYFNLDNSCDLADLLYRVSRGQMDLNAIAKANSRKVRQIASREMYFRRLTSIYENRGDLLPVTGGLKGKMEMAS
jgi:glycosyltransferase involved in cell wall biosynthesis